MTAPADGHSFKAIETHVSWVVFAGDRAFKIKKPVLFDFVDWRTEEARAAACRTEVDLNRRLAPDVYEGVGQFSYPDGRVEPVVVMRRLPADRSLSALIRRNDSSLQECVVAVAGTLARFHLRARRGEDVDANCGPDRLGQLWESNLAAIRVLEACPIGVAQLDRAGLLAARYLRGRKVLVEERIREGHSVDGHGDPLCDDVFCLDDGPRILDCLEFDPKLREADTVADLAFLAMDLEHRGRSDLVTVLSDAYQSVSGDAWPESWSDFWIAYRATVRAKVSCLRSVDGDPEAAAEARDLMSLALTHLHRAQPRLLLVGGLPATGKSTLAQAIAARTGWLVISSDVIRQRVAGPAADLSAGEYGKGRYSPDRVAANYRELVAAARERLVRGRSVIVDATWSSSRQRQAAARMAEEVGATLVALECTAPPDVARRRILARAPGGASEATPEVAAEMAARWEPWPESLRLDTTDGIEPALRKAAHLWADDQMAGLEA